MNVLVVEDQAVDARIATRMIETAFANANVDIAVDAADAERHIHSNDYDLIVVDLGLPDAVGPATIKRLRKAAPELTLVVFTGDDSDETLAACMGSGADDYIIKGSLNADDVARRLRIATMRHADYLRRWFEGNETKDEAWVHAVINDIAHELRTPLTSLRASAAALRKDGHDERHERIVRNVDRLAEAVEAIWGGVADHVLMEKISVKELLTDVGERANEAVRISTIEDMTIIGQRASLRRALQIILRIVAMEQGPPNVTWGDDGFGKGEIVVETSNPTIFASHPVMGVLVSDYLHRSLGDVAEESRGVVLSVPLHRAARGKPSPMSAAVPREPSSEVTKKFADSMSRAPGRANAPR